MSGSNYVSNIIVNLASLPDFLRKPILKKRMIEFFSMSEEEKDEAINNALEAGPTIPFPNFSKLFKTWLEVLASLSEEQRNELFSKYVTQIIRSPEKLISFNLDGILEIFLSIDISKKDVLATTLKDIILKLDGQSKNRLFMIIPDASREHIGI